MLFVYVLSSALAVSAVFSGGSSQPTQVEYEESEQQSLDDSTTEVGCVAVDIDARAANLKFVLAIQRSTMWTDVKRRTVKISNNPRLAALLDADPESLPDDDLALLKGACHDGLKCVAVDQLLVLRSATDTLPNGLVAVRQVITKITHVLTNYTTEYYEDTYQYEEVTESDDRSKVEETVTVIVEDNKELCGIKVGDDVALMEDETVSTTVTRDTQDVVDGTVSVRLDGGDDAAVAAAVNKATTASPAAKTNPAAKASPAPTVDKVTTAAKASPVTTPAKVSPVTTVDKASPVTTADKATTAAKASPVNTVDKASPVTTAAKASPVNSVQKASQVTTDLILDEEDKDDWVDKSRVGDRASSTARDHGDLLSREARADGGQAYRGGDSARRDAVVPTAVPTVATKVPTSARTVATKVPTSARTAADKVPVSDNAAAKVPASNDDAAAGSDLIRSVKITNDGKGGDGGDSVAKADVASAGDYNEASVKKGYVEDGIINNGDMNLYNVNTGTINKGTVNTSGENGSVVNVGTLNNGPANYGTVETMDDAEMRQYMTKVDQMYSAIIDGLSK